jgi:hypothetical protein
MYIPRLAMIMLLGFGAAIVVAPVAAVLAVGGTVSPLLVLALVVSAAIVLGLFYGVTLAITMYGVKLAAAIFKFEVPEDGRSRLMGMAMVGVICTVPIVLIGVLLTAKTGAGGGAIAAMILCGGAAYLLSSFASFALLFHMKIWEAIPAYLLMMVFYLLGSIASNVISSIIGFASKGIVMAVMGHH